MQAIYIISRIKSYKDKELYKYNHLSIYSTNGRYLFSVFKGSPGDEGQYFSNPHGDRAFLDEINDTLIIYKTKMDLDYLTKLIIK